MLAIRIIAVGRDKTSWVSAQIEHYRKLIGRYARLEIITVPEAKYGKGSDIAKSLAAEAAAIEKRMVGDFCFPLDVKGQAFTTRSLAGLIRKLAVDGHSRLDFIIGGPYGLAPELKAKKKNRRVLSLSPLTMSHQVVRLVLLEQLYRVLNLNAGGNYHK